METNRCKKAKPKPNMGKGKERLKTSPTQSKWQQQDKEISDLLIEKIKQGTAPWQKPWTPAHGCDLPHNPTTGKPYRGMNMVALMLNDRDDPRWMTYKQAQAQGAQVRKGEKGTRITFWKTHDEKTVTGANGEKTKVREKLDRPKPFGATLFNAEQVDGLEPLPQPSPHEQNWGDNKRVDDLLKNSQADIIHKAGDRAFYSPTTDKIVLPERSQFDNADDYYATASHELGHWTGHKSRLDRPLMNRFGTPDYAREELRAEIASMMLSRELGVGYKPRQSASYAERWIEALQNDHKEIRYAAKDAQDIMNYVMNYDTHHITPEVPNEE